MAGVMTQARQKLGKAGEDLACRELERRGYAIVARRYRADRGELDIIARDGATLVFVEVKAREDLRFGGGAAAITALSGLMAPRRARLHGAPACRRLPCRFDVVSIHFGGGEPVFELFQNAFTSRSMRG